VIEDVEGDYQANCGVKSERKKDEDEVYQKGIEEVITNVIGERAKESDRHVERHKKMALNPVSSS